MNPHIPTRSGVGVVMTPNGNTTTATSLGKMPRFFAGPSGSRSPLNEDYLHEIPVTDEPELGQTLGERSEFCIFCKSFFEHDDLLLTRL